MNRLCRLSIGAPLTGWLLSAGLTSQADSSLNSGSPPLADTAPFAVAQDQIEAAHARMLNNAKLQTELPSFEEAPTPPPPDWLRALMDFISGIFDTLAPLFQFIFWGGVVLIVVLLAIFVLREVIGLRLPFLNHKKNAAHPVQTGYQPEEHVARALLEDADKLAAAGKYDEAVRLILTRSIQDIEQQRPGRIHRSYTSREIAEHNAIPSHARPAFRRIAAIVESALFAGHALNQKGFLEARDAYETFALPEAWRA